MYTDSHCHLNRLNLEAHDGEIAGVIEAMKAAQVSRAMAIMCDFAEYDEIYGIVRQYSDESLNLGMSVGIHPCEDLAVLESATVERLTEMASPEHVWAIGETGLDYYWSQENIEAQKQSLARHIHASQQLKKPLIVHTREAKKTRWMCCGQRRQSTASSTVLLKIGRRQSRHWTLGFIFRFQVL